jgi:hypothetical protein
MGEWIRFGLTLAALIAVGGYGLWAFPSSNLQSTRYVTRPSSKYWGPVKFFNRSEWTPEGLEYRRRFMKWWLLFVSTLTVSMWMWN